MRILVAFVILINIVFNTKTIVAQVDKNSSKAEQRKQLSEFIQNHPYSQNTVSYEQIKDLAKEDRPDLRLRHDFFMTFDPFLGYVPHDRRLKALKIAKTRIANNKNPISGVSWQEHGPTNFGGRTRALMYDPNDSENAYKKVWGGGVSGGLWFTDDITDAGESWQRVDDFWSNIAISCIAYDPSSTQVFYVGTGEGYFNLDAVEGGGIWKSSNGGTTWSNVLAPGPSTWATLAAYFVQDIEVASNGVVFASCKGYYRNTGGILKSINGGTSWSVVLAPYTGTGLLSSNPTMYDWATDIEIASNGDIYAAFGIETKGKIYKSTNGGTNWTDVTPATGGYRIEIAVAPSNPLVVYAVAGKQSGSGYDDVAWFKKSTNGGSSWSTISTPLYMEQSCSYGTDHFTNGQAWYNLILAVKPDNPDYVLAGGIDLHLSTDGGSNWDIVSFWTGACKQQVHADQHAIEFHPTDADQAIFGNDGGVYFTDNADLNTILSISSRNMGFNVTQFYSCAMKNSVGSNYYLAGAQDNGSHKFTDANLNETFEVTGGDGGFCFIDQDNPNYQLTSYVYNNWRRSTDGGASFTNITSSSSGWFINPADYDNSADILYSAAGVNQYYRISGISGTITATTVSATLGGAYASAVTVSDYTSNAIFIGTHNGQIFKITNANATPTVTDLDGSNTLPVGHIACIEVGQSDNQLLVTYSSYGILQIYETVDGGTNWINKTGLLPDMPIRFALYNPDNRNEVLIATEVGVWSTTDISVTTPDWDPTNTGLANVRCDMLQYRPTDKMVAVATHGRGLYTSDVFVDRIPFTDFEASNTNACLNCKVKFTDLTMYKPTSWAWSFDPTSVTYLNSTTSSSQNPEVKFTSAGTYEVTLTATNSNGSDPEVKSSYITVTSSTQSIPYTCGFEIADGFSYGLPGTLASDWSRDPSSSGYFWYVDKSGTPSDFTGPKSAYGGSNYLYTEASDGDDKDRAYLVTPCIDLTSFSDATLTFWYHMYGINIQGLYLDAFCDGEWVNADFITGQHQYDDADAWLQQSVELDQFVGEVIKLRFWTQKTAYDLGDIAIDDISIAGISTLSVEWVSMNGQCKDEGIVLSWSVASQESNDYFTVERMNEDDVFENIGVINGAGTSNEEITYEYVDNNVDERIYYYRIKQTDYDGESKYSKVISVNCKSNNPKSLLDDMQIYPNPFSNKIIIKLKNEMDEEFSIDVFNSLGENIYKRNSRNFDDVSRNYFIITEGWSNGVYLVRISSNYGQMSKKVVKE